MARSKAKFLFKIVARRQQQGDTQEGKEQSSQDTAVAKDDVDLKAVLNKSFFIFIFSC